LVEIMGEAFCARPCATIEACKSLITTRRHHAGGLLFAGGLTRGLRWTGIMACDSEKPAGQVGNCVETEKLNRLRFHYPARVMPLGDGSYRITPGKLVVRETLRVQEVAMKLDVTVRHVIDLIEEGHIEAVNLAGNKRMFWRVRIEALAKFMNERSSLNLKKKTSHAIR
jgi:excisionase family DNA binding protein